MIRKVPLSIILSLCFLVPGLVSAQGEGRGEVEDESKMFHELGFSYLLQGNRAKARELFQKAAAAKGQYADISRLQLIRLLALEKRKAGESRLPQVRAALKKIEDDSWLKQAWYAAMRSLYDYGEKEGALELALEMPQRFPESKMADAAALLAAEIMYERRHLSAALDQLLGIVNKHPKGDGEYTDDAYYLLALVFNTPGEYYSPRKAYGALLAFRRFKDRRAFKRSIRLEEARRLLEQLSRRQ